MIPPNDWHRWTIASWRLGEWARDRDRFIDQLEAIGADAIALQRLTARAARAISDALDLPHVWERSHYPEPRIAPRPSVGLAVLTPHRVTATSAIAVTSETSTWSSRRRILQTVALRRSDGQTLAISHRSDSGSGPPFADIAEHTPVLSINPFPAVGGDTPRISVPTGGSLRAQDVLTPIEGAPPLVVTSFETARARDDFAAS